MKNKLDIFGSKASQAWENFTKNEQLTERQKNQFEQYIALLLEWNKKFNITTITDGFEVITYHFQDSLQIGQFVDFSNKMVVDIGTGGGFPGVPLKIKYPDTHMILLEVSHKKTMFLEHLITTLGLEKIQVWPFDWRTFLRKTSFDVAYFLARASLQMDELLRMFKPSCPYKHAELIYWASKKWKVGEKEQQYFEKSESYKIGNKQRQFIFFKLKTT